jgi:hypothetical protein
MFPSSGPSGTPPAGPTSVPAPIGAPTGTVTPASVAAGSFTLAGNGLIAQATEPAVPIIAGAINYVVEQLKKQAWFREQQWGFLLTVLLAVAAGVGIWWLLQHDAYKAVVNACGVLTNVHLNYEGIKQSPLDILKPTAAENRWQPKG